MLLTEGAFQASFQAFHQYLYVQGPRSVCSKQSHRSAGCVPLARNCSVSSNFDHTIIEVLYSHLFFTSLLSQKLERHPFLPSSIFS